MKVTTFLIISVLFSGYARAQVNLVLWNSTDTGSAGSWGGNDFNQPDGDYGLGDPNVDDGRKLREFDLEGTPLNTSGSSSVWYVGFEFLQGDYSGGVNDGTRTYGPSTSVRIQASGTQPGEMYYLQMWKKTDFNNLSESPAITFGEDSVLTASGGLERSARRWVVLDNDTFYVSEGGNITSNPNLANWAVYTPSNTLRGFAPSENLLDYSPHTFTDIQAVGYLMHASEGGDFVAEGRIWGNTDNVVITAIPEPATLGLLGFAGLFALYLRRRNRG